MFLINCEIEFDLSWSGYSVITKIFKAVPNTDPVENEVAITTNSETFQINNAKIYVPVVTLSINNGIKFLENIKQGLKRTICWNKYRSEITS